MSDTSRAAPLPAVAGAGGRRAAPRRAALTWAVSIGGLGAVALVVLLTAAGILAIDSEDSTFVLILYFAMSASFSLSGAVLRTRVPDNRVGLILWSAGLGLTVLVVAHALGVQLYLARGDSLVAAGAVLLSRAAIQFVFCLVMAILPLCYPTGRPPSRRWRPLLWYATAILVFSIIKELGTPGPLDALYPVPNPLALDTSDETDKWNAIETLDFLLLLTVIPACVLSLVTRYRHGGTIERQQLKWFGLVAGVMAVLFIIAILAPNEAAANTAWGLAILTLPILPIAIGVAVLRYRLYEIDRIVSRSISWTLLTGLLVVVFVAGVVGLQALLTGFTNGETIAVAASTLVAFALFQPLRRRIQRAVDRRFDRGRYSGEQLSAAFAGRLRDEVALDAVAKDLQATVDHAVRPAVQALWLRPEPATVLREEIVTR